MRKNRRFVHFCSGKRNAGLTTCAVDKEKSGYIIAARQTKQERQIRFAEKGRKSQPTCCEAGWCMGSRYYPRERNQRERLAETAARAESKNRESKRGLENPEILDRCANPENRPLGLGRFGLPDRLPFSDCQVKAILQVDAISFLHR